MSKSRQGAQAGQDFLEFALTLPILIMLLLGIFDLGRAAIFYSLIYNAAREGARYGIIHPDDPAGIESVVRNKAILSDLLPENISTVQLDLDGDASDTEAIQVSVSYQFMVVTPIITVLAGSSEFTFNTQSTMQIEH
jgi:Flp pilus assembly protein TadG